MQVNLHIITLFYTLYNRGVNSVAYICGLQKHEEKNEKKIGSSVKCVDAFRIALTGKPKLLIKQKYN